MDVLLVIDMQEGFRYKESEKILGKIQNLCKKIHPYCYFSRFKDRENSNIEKHTRWKKFQKKKAWPLMEELQKFATNDRIVDHYTYTVLTSQMEEIFNKKNIETVYLAGVYTDVCIIKTAMDLIDHEFRVKVIEDACASLHGTKSHKQAINSLKHIIGKENIINSRATHMQ